MLLSRTRHEYHVKSDTRVRVFQVSAIPHPNSVGFVFACLCIVCFVFLCFSLWLNTESLSSVLDTWFLALIMIGLAWRTAQTITDAPQPGCAKKFGVILESRGAFGTPGGRFGDGVRFWSIFLAKVSPILGSILAPKNSKVPKKQKKSSVRSVAFKNFASRAHPKQAKV